MGGVVEARGGAAGVEILGRSAQSVRRNRGSTSRIGNVPLETVGGRLVAYLERRTPWDP